MPPSRSRRPEMGAAFDIAALPAEPAWLTEARRHAADGFALPTQKQEAWKFTALHSLKDQRLDAEEISDLTFAGPVPDGVRLLCFADALAEMPDLIEAHLKAEGVNLLPFPALNTACARDGYVLVVEDGVRAETPIEISFAGDAAQHPRNLIVAGAGSRVSVLQRHTGGGFTNAVTKLLLAADARVGFYRLQAENAEAHHISTVEARLAAGAQLNNYTLTLGGALSRNEIHVALAGTGAFARVDGGYLLAGAQHGDTTTYIDHRAPETESTQTYKGVLDDKAHGVFAGRIKIHPDAQRVEGRQLSRALLLSTDATINAKPELEIHADDVKCSHGATAGELAEDALFYLRSRGIPERLARHMLIEAFVAEGIEEIADETVRESFRAEVGQWLEAHRR